MPKEKQTCICGHTKSIHINVGIKKNKFTKTYCKLSSCNCKEYKLKEKNGKNGVLSRDK